MKWSRIIFCLRINKQNFTFNYVKVAFLEFNYHLSKPYYVTNKWDQWQTQTNLHVCSRQTDSVEPWTERDCSIVGPISRSACSFSQQQPSGSGCWGSANAQCRRGKAFCHTAGTTYSPCFLSCGMSSPSRATGGKKDPTQLMGKTNDMRGKMKKNATFMTL